MGKGRWRGWKVLLQQGPVWREGTSFVLVFFTHSCCACTCTAPSGSIPARSGIEGQGWGSSQQPSASIDPAWKPRRDDGRSGCGHHPGSPRQSEDTRVRQAPRAATSYLHLGAARAADRSVHEGVLEVGALGADRKKKRKKRGERGRAGRGESWHPGRFGPSGHTILNLDFTADRKTKIEFNKICLLLSWRSIYVNSPGSSAGVTLLPLMSSWVRVCFFSRGLRALF